MNRLWIIGALVVALAGTAKAAVLEVPQNGGRASGVGFISGWKCPPNDNLTAVIDGGAPIPLAGGIRRGDTATACGNDGRNGYISQINFGNLGHGPHVIVIRQGSQTFAQGLFTVTTFGQPFMTGASGTYTLQNFPAAGQTATIEWVEGAQNFVITGRGGSPITPTPTPKPQPTAKPTPTPKPQPTAKPTPTPKPTAPPAGCPASGPLRDLRIDCSANMFLYTRNGVLAGMTSDGEVVAMCLTSISTTDIICMGGDVLAATQFDLQIANLNGGPYSLLGAGSGGVISSSGQSLSFTTFIGGDRFDFPNLAYSSRRVLGTAATATEDDVQALAAATLEAVRSGAVAGAQASGADTASASAALAEVLGQLAN